MMVTMVKEPGIALGRNTLALPAAYSAADLTLSNSNSLLAANQTKTIAIANGTAQATGVYTSLRPGSGYKLEAVVKNAGTRVAAGFVDGVTLIAGSNTVTIILGIDGNIKIATGGSGAGNTFGDATEWIIVKGDTYTFNTGFDSNEATKVNGQYINNLKMQVILGSAIYSPNTQPIIDEVTTNLNQYVFTTGTSVNPSSTPGYDKDKLTVAAGSNIIFRLKSGTQTVGESTLTPVRVIAGADINLVLQ